MTTRHVQRNFAFALGVVLALGTPGAARAVTVDGRLDPSYQLMATQATQTDRSDGTSGLATFSTGSELDAAYATVDGGVLYLFFAGNLMDTICGVNPCTAADQLEVFLDTKSGGQNVLLQGSPFGAPYTGVTFDSGFAPDYAIEFWAGGALDQNFSRQAGFSTLPTATTGSLVMLGSGSNAGAPGTLSGGVNPWGIQATIDNSNTGGVTAGCSAQTPGSVLTGVELAIPLAAIGDPTGCISVCAFLNANLYYGVSNQILPPLPPGTCFASNLNYASVNLGNYPGTHFFAICPGAVPVRRSTWGGLKITYR